FRVGEYIDAGAVAGTVREIGLFATELRTFDGLYVLAPNSSLWGTPVKNFSRNADRRTDILIGIGYDDDVALAKSTLMDMLIGDSRVYKEPEPAIFVTELAASAINLNVRYWSASSDFERLKSDMTASAKRLLEEKGITIPFPQQEVHFVPQDLAGQAQKSAKPALVLDQNN
ncbi:MAG TPA: mechanosensitive ion channel domain-containing protein, partial [Tianweitania sediminis]|nr:mechanosensitive ion channel domain-containing protein [Tianweitania sediminis]